MFPTDTVMYCDSFKHHSEHVEGPQLDQEEMTTVAVLGLQPGTEAWRGCHSTHISPAACQNADGKEWGLWMGWGREGVHFPEGLFSFPRDSVSPTEKPKGRFLFWLCFGNKALTCSLMGDIKLSVWCLASGKTWPFFGGAVFSPLPWWN